MQALLWLLSVALATMPLAEGFKTQILELNRRIWDETLAEHQFVLVEFYTDGCQHCRKFKPKYAEAAKQLSGLPDLLVAKIDGERQSGLTEEYSVSGFPTVLLFKPGQAEPVRYKGPHEAASLVSFVEDERAPSSVRAESFDLVLQAAATAAQRERVLAVGLFADRQSMEKLDFSTVAAELRRKVGFAHCYSPSEELLAKLGLGMQAVPSVVIVDALHGKAVVRASAGWSGFSNSSDLERWVRAHSFALIAQLTADNDAEYRSQPLPIALLLYSMSDTDPTVQLRLEALRTAAAAASGQQGFLTAFADATAVDMARFNMSGAPLPGLVVCRFQQRQYFPLISTTAPSVEQMLQHIDQAVRGALRPLTRSEPIHPLSVKSVRRLVGHNFEEAFDSDRDVLVMVYANWCTHSMEFMPNFQKIARVLRFVKTVTVASIDMAANDVAMDGWSVEGYPAFRLVKAGSNQVVHYQGDRAARALIDWTREHATHSFDYDPVEVNFLGHLEGIESLGDSVRTVMKQNRELEKQVVRLRAELEAAKEKCDAGVASAPKEEL